MSDLMIEVEGLTKDYGLTRAVDKVSFNVRRGEVLGFLGPNGAGQVDHDEDPDLLPGAHRRAGRWSPGTTCSTIRSRCASASATCPKTRRSTAT